MAGTSGGGDTVSFQKFQFKNTGTATNAHIALDAKDTTGVDSALALKNNRLYKFKVSGTNLGNSDLTQSDPTRTFTVGTGNLTFTAKNAPDSTSIFIENDEFFTDVYDLNAKTESFLSVNPGGSQLHSQDTLSSSDFFVVSQGIGSITTVQARDNLTTRSKQIKLESPFSGYVHGIDVVDDIDNVGLIGNQLFPVSGDNKQYVQFGNLSGIGTTTNPLTAGYGIASAGTFNGAVARTFSADTTSSGGLVSKSRLATNLGGYVPGTRTVAGFALSSNVTLASLTIGNGLLGTSYNPSGATTVKADTTVLQTVLNFFPKGDTRYLKTTTASSTYVPYTGATGNVTLGSNIISAQSFTISATGGLGFLNLPTQSGTPTTPGSGQHLIYTNPSGQFSILGSNGFALGFSRALLTASRVYSFPDATTTILGTDNTANISNKTYLPANTYQTPIATTPTTDSLVVKEGGKLFAATKASLGLGSSNLTTQSITSGSSGTVTGGNYRVLFNPSSTLASYALTLPASPNDGDVVEVICGGTLTSGIVVTSLTISANSGQTLQDNTPPGNATVDFALKYVYISGNTKWYREKF